MCGFVTTPTGSLKLHPQPQLLLLWQLPLLLLCPHGNLQLRRPKLRSRDRSKLGLHKGLRLPTIPGDLSAQPPKPLVWVCPTCRSRPQTSLHNHNHGIHILCYADPSHICWESIQCFCHPAAVQVHLQDTACSYGRGHFSKAVAIWAPLVLAMFQSITQALSLTNIEALVSFITSTHSKFLLGIDTPDTDDIEVFWYLQKYWQCSLSAHYCYMPPTCIEVLLQWYMLSGLLSLVPLPQHISIMNVPSQGRTTTIPSAALGSKPKSMAKAVSKVDPKQRQGSAVGKPKVVVTSSIPSLLSIPNRAPGTLANAADKSSVANVKAQPTVSPPQAASSIQSKSAAPDLASTILLLGADAHLHAPELITRSKLTTLQTAILCFPATWQLRVDHLSPHTAGPTNGPKALLHY